MNSYAAFLGHQPHISTAELAAVAENFSLTKTIFKNIILFESSEDLTPEKLSNLGGTPYIAKRITEESLSLEDVPQLLGNELSAVKGKATFSFRTFGLRKPELHSLYRNAKTYLKKKGRPSRYVGSENKLTPAVLLHDAGIVDGSHGCELTIIRDGDALWIGRTICAQDVDAYTKRDMDKPVRDTTVGLLPPKLAQMLLNFGEWMAKSTGNPKLAPVTGKKKNPPLLVFDPFCGTGVIPMEALLRGSTVLASDLSLKAVNGCEKNLDWLRKEEKILKKDVPSTVWKQDAQKPFELKEKPDIVVTETTLGPPLTKAAPLREAEKMKNEVERIEAGFFENAAKTLPGVPVVCIFPVWFHSKGEVRLEKIWTLLGKLGYQATLPPGIKPDTPGRLSLTYRRPDQFVGREIVILKHRVKK
ncbi:MAG: RsmD family RNA methyltransferase [Candidatus Peregrinibacteria bacterium]|nr:RsmD family RNA methyltransferase [Candidatus Peregrinibacteria bacterium]